MSVPRTILEAWNGKKSFLKLTFPYLVAAAAPMDLRSVVDNADELDMLIATACVYDGMRVWVESEQKLYIYCLLDNNGGYGFKPFADSFTAAEVERLKTIRHIQGKPFNGQQDVESGLVYPEQITIPEDKTLYDILTTTVCIKSGDNRPTLQPGFYYWQDTDSGKYIALIVERLGAEIMVDDTTLVNNESVTLRVDKSTYKYTLTTIDNGALTILYGVSSYAAGQGGETHTRTVEWITAPTRLSDATNDAVADASKGVAATPKAVAAKADLTDLAPAWSKNSAYSVGEYVTYGGDLYRCKVAVVANTNWSTTNFAKVAVGAELIAEATARSSADAILRKIIGIKNIYTAICNSDAVSGNIPITFVGAAPDNLEIGDVVIVQFAVNQDSATAEKFLLIGNKAYSGFQYAFSAGDVVAFICTSASSIEKFDSVLGKIDSKANKRHTSSLSADIGKGSATQYGHLKLSDDIDAENDTSAGVAATPAAVAAIILSIIQDDIATCIEGSLPATVVDVDGVKRQEIHSMGQAEYGTLPGNDSSPEAGKYAVVSLPELKKLDYARYIRIGSDKFYIPSSAYKAGFHLFKCTSNAYGVGAWRYILRLE